MQAVQELPAVFNVGKTLRSEVRSQQLRLNSFVMDRGDDRIYLKGLVFHGYHGALPEVRYVFLSSDDLDTTDQMS